jgi:hypothetical protein
MVQESDPGGKGSEIFRTAPVQTGPGAHLASYTVGAGPSRRVQRPGRSIDHPPPSSAKVKERVELYIYSTSGHSWPILG